MTNTRQRRVTLKDIAQRAGVTPAAVSLALNDKDGLPPSRKRQIRKIAEELGYRPSPLARALRGGHTNTIGVVINYFHNAFFHPIFQGVEKVTEDEGYSFWVAQTHDDLRKEEQEVRRFAEQGVDGILLHAATSRTEHLTALTEEYGLPIILLAHAHPGFSAVVANDYDGASAAARHLAMAGHKVLHIAGPQEKTAIRDRYRGWRDIAASQGRDFQEETDLARVKTLTADEGYRAMAELAARHPLPFSVFVANDETAFGALRYCREKGVAYPEEARIMGFGGLPLIDQLGLELSTMIIPLEEMGATAARLLLDDIRFPSRGAGPRTTVLPVALSVRGSSAP